MTVDELTMPEGPVASMLLRSIDLAGAGRVEAGTAVISKGAVIPVDGFSRHAATEVAVVLTGALKIVTASREQQVNAGEMVILPAGEAHRSVGLDDTTLVYFHLFDAGAPPPA